MNITREEAEIILKWAKVVWHVSEWDEGCKTILDCSLLSKFEKAFPEITTNLQENTADAIVPWS